VTIRDRLIPWLFDGKHAFADATRRCDDWVWAMQNEPHVPFHGPPAVGELLERVLVADPAQRMPAAELAAGLAGLAALASPAAW
jgi:hypothetical protein